MLQASFDLEAWKRGFREVEPLANGYYVIEGVSFPDDLRGTFFRNGPGKFEVTGGCKVQHPLDGDGLVLGVTFSSNGQIFVRHRLIMTQGLLRDNVYKTVYSNGLYGAQAQGGLTINPIRQQPKHTANAGLAWWEGKLLATWPLGKPYVVDPYNLGTVVGSEDNGASDLGGGLEKDFTFATRPKVCATENILTTVSQVPSALETTVRFIEFKGEEWKSRYPIALPRTFRLGGYAYFSDYAITPKWFILAKPPVKVNTMAAIVSKPFTEVLEADDNATSELIIATRLKRDQAEVNVPLDKSCIEEFANSFETEDGHVVLDVVASEKWSVQRADGSSPCWLREAPGQLPRRQLIRYDVDLNTKAWTKRVLSDRHVSAPTVHPNMVGKKHRYVFAAVSHAGVGPMAGIVKVDVESGTSQEWVPGPSEFASNPVFAPKDGSTAEDAGYLLTTIFDGASQRTDVVVLDAADLSRGPVVRFSLEQAMPHGLSGCWAQGLTTDKEEMGRKITLLRLFEKKAQSWNEMNTSFTTLGANFFAKQGGTLR